MSGVLAFTLTLIKVGGDIDELDLLAVKVASA